MPWQLAKGKSGVALVRRFAPVDALKGKSSSTKRTAELGGFLANRGT